ncbi:MAG TPA: universal stress protein [Rhizomicrobium sp.]|nr:universal stress protein [Rhizomicrobium sp.]
MAYRTVMTYLQAGADNQGVLGVVSDLAGLFDASVIGISACQPVNPMYEEGFTAGDVVVEDRAEINKELAAAEQQFRDVLDSKVARLEWRSTVTYGLLADYVAEQARAADLIVLGKPVSGAFFDRTRWLDVGSLVMQAGRPVLLVPNAISSLSLRHVIAGWKDTREARRAVSDALPLLRAAERSTVLEVCKAGQRAQAQQRVQDVASWLERLDVHASPLAVEAEGTEIGFLRREMHRHTCDLLVAGAYGHNRLNEWVFGGVTQDFLLDPEFCVLLSH